MANLNYPPFALTLLRIHTSQKFTIEVITQNITDLLFSLSIQNHQLTLIDKYPIVHERPTRNITKMEDAEGSKLYKDEATGEMVSKR